MVSCKNAAIHYPEAPESDTVDSYFGTRVSDRYRPLENDTAAETLRWVEAERKVTDEYLSRIPFRNEVRRRVEELNDYAKYGMPWKGNDGKYYFYRNDGLKNQAILFRSDSIGGVPEVFINPNELSADGTVALTGVFMLGDGRYTAYTVSRSGSDWTEIYVMETESKKLLADHIEWAKFTGACWRGDGFYYSAYERPADGKELSDANENHRIYYHRLGTPQSADEIVYEDVSQPLHFHSAYVSPDEKLLFVIGAGEGIGNSVMLTDIDRPGSGWRLMEPSQDFDVSVVDVADGLIYFTTSYDAPCRRLMTAPVDSPAKENWKVLVPEAEGVLTSAQRAGDKLLLVYERDASNYACIIDRDGSNSVDIDLPGYCSVAFSSDAKHDDVFYRAVSQLLPPSVYSYDLATGESSLYASPAIKNYNPDDFVTEQVFYKSADGTEIPMFITYRKGLERDGRNPLYLYGYGGFNISLNPRFNASLLHWLENGGIYAEANLRGGGEYGEEWHLAGTKMNKLNVFNDFIAAAEYMIAEGWTSPEHIVIEGGSNGGLLVGACVNMRPDLYRVAVPRVGVMDMMRYHLFTIGWNWAPDYGTSGESPEMAAYLLGYSPLHNISDDGTPYPAIMVTTADHDDRVVPAHSFKYAAALQAADTGDAPKIIRIDSNAGHGAGKPVAKVIDEYTDILSFIYYNMGIEPGRK